MRKIGSLLLVLLLAAAFVCPAAAGTASVQKEDTAMTASTPLAEGIYKIQNKATGRFLNMQLAGMVDRAYVQQFGETGMLDELWRFTKDGDGYLITNLFVPRHLAVRETPAQAGGALHVSIADTPGNKWMLYPVGDSFRLAPADGPRELGMGLPVNDIASKYLPVVKPYEQDDTSLWDLVPVSLARELPAMLPVTGEVFHASCPQVIKQGDTYYLCIMYPGVLIKSSKDLIHWETVGTVFSPDPSWLSKEVPGYGIWAPSIYFFNGKYYLYYCISTLGSQNSAIGLAVNATLDPSSPDYNWVDEGMVIRSHTGAPYNCIDPNIAVDEDGKVWLNFGSYWGGLYQREIDPQTGLLMDPAESPEGLYHLGQRTTNNTALEASYMVWHDGYYYLFCAFNPMDLTYHNRVGRSQSVHGPFVDKDGRQMLHGGGTVVTKGLYEVPKPGHASVFQNEDGQYYLVGEYLKDNTPSLLYISTIVWDKDGWPVTALTPDIAQRLPAE